MPFSNNYNAVDRFLHSFAFSSPAVQKVLFELENEVFKRNLKAVDSRDEVFITGLPRAGTTLILELLYATGEFGTYTYRDMPFIMSPLFWNKLTMHFGKTGEMLQRAHGDGMEISIDSPEAFDEVIWLSYLAKRIIHGDMLTPIYPKDISEEFRDAIQNSVRKVLTLAQQSDQDSLHLRYLSKNNANISRIGTLLHLFPSAKVLILFRHPLAHISSLSRQHARFLKEHRSNAFSRKYMKWIGHYEFGANLKPINFGGWLDEARSPFRIDEAFWLGYWNAAYEFALQQRAENVLFIDFDRLLADGASSLARLAESLELNHIDTLLEAGERLRSPTSQFIDANRFPKNLWDRAQDIHSQLVSTAI